MSRKRKIKWDRKKCCFLVDIFVTATIKAVLIGTSYSPGPLVWK